MSRQVRSWSVRLFPSVLLAALLAAACAALLTGCGGAKTAAAATPAATHSAKQILAGVYTADPKIRTATATYDVTFAIKPIPGGSASSDLGPLANGPVSVKGDVTISEQPLAMDLTADLGMTGMSMKMGMRYVGGKAWIEYLGQWYALPADAVSSLPQSLRQSNASLTLMTKLGIDPMKWTKDLTVVGQETLGGKPVYHLTMNLDVPQFFTDLVKIMNSAEFKSLVGQSAQITGSAPTAKDLADLTSAIKTAKLEIWATADTFYATKAVLNVNIVVPKKDQKDAQFSSMKLAATVLYRSIDQPVSVKAPAHAKPYSDMGLSLGGSTVSTTSSGSSTASTPAATYDPSASAEAKVKAGVQTIAAGIQKYARANNDTYPATANQAVLAKYVATWPANPFTGAPMANSGTSGNYQYEAAAGSFSIVGFGADGNVVISLP